jgi:hypothetical protein
MKWNINCLQIEYNLCIFIINKQGPKPSVFLQGICPILAEGASDFSKGACHA